LPKAASMAPFAEFVRRFHASRPTNDVYATPPRDHAEHSIGFAAPVGLQPTGATRASPLMIGRTHKSRMSRYSTNATISNETTMGKQVNFYMTVEDEQKFVQFVRGERNVAIFKSVLPTTEIPNLIELPPVGEPFWFSLCLWNRDESPPPTLTYVEQQRYYSVGKIDSEIIEFDRCVLDQGRLVRGRIWAEMNGWKREDPATIIKKSDAFSAWYNRLASWIKRHSTRNDRGQYLMPGAARFAEHGGTMC
jgi:hypothetical protein